MLVKARNFTLKNSVIRTHCGLAGSNFTMALRVELRSELAFGILANLSPVADTLVNEIEEPICRCSLAIVGLVVNFAWNVTVPYIHTSRHPKTMHNDRRPTMSNKSTDPVHAVSRILNDLCSYGGMACTQAVPAPCKIS